METDGECRNLTPDEELLESKGCDRRLFPDRGSELLFVVFVPETSSFHFLNYHQLLFIKFKYSRVCVMVYVWVRVARWPNDSAKLE